MSAVPRSLGDLLAAIADDVEAILRAPNVLLGDASPPSVSGVYMLSVGDEVTYVGEAKGGKGLRDRLLSKHLTGDDSYAIQRAFLVDFLDRLLRRDHIRAAVSARWVEIPDRDRVSAVERTLICLYGHGGIRAEALLPCRRLAWDGTWPRRVSLIKRKNCFGQRQRVAANTEAATWT